MTIAIPEYIDRLPMIAGREADLEKAIRAAASTEYSGRRTRSLSAASRRHARSRCTCTSH